MRINITGFWIHNILHRISRTETFSPWKQKKTTNCHSWIRVSCYKIMHGFLETKVYRKPTHTDQYLNWESNHYLEHKQSVVRTLLRRAEKVVSREEDRKTEVKHVKKVLKVNGDKGWIFKLPKRKKTANDQEEPGPGPHKKKTPVALPYIKETTEDLPAA